MPPCPLCTSGHPVLYHRGKERPYLHCEVCGLIFVPSAHHLPPDDERAEYEKHENCVDDPGYREFLSRLFRPMAERLKRDARGLDFGCGPGPALAEMFREAGFSVTVYDPFFAPDEHVLETTYDFITLTEVAEHLREPRIVFERLIRMLNPGGWLGIMTGRVLNREAFTAWRYIQDPTHIAFYSETTFIWLAEYLDCTLTLTGKDTVLLQKRGSSLSSGPKTHDQEP